MIEIQKIVAFMKMNVSFYKFCHPITLWLVMEVARLLSLAYGGARALDKPGNNSSIR